MPNPFKAEIEAEIGGITRRLRLGANELVELQQHLGKGPIVLVNACARDALARQRADESHIPLFDYAEAVAVIHFGMRGGGATHDFKKTLSFLGEKLPNDLIALAQKLLLVAFGHDIPEDAEGNGSAPGESR